MNCITNNLKKIQEVELSILKYIDKLCRENQIDYFLIGGSLLGAVRHAGFIPWDDDIDIGIKRSDYNKFVKLCNDSRYKILTPETAGYYYNFIKIIDSKTKLVEKSVREIVSMGIYVDVFIIEDLPGDYKEAYRTFKKMNRIRKGINRYSLVPTLRKNLIKMAESFIMFYFGFNRKLLKLQKKYATLANKFVNAKGEYIYISGGAYNEKDIVPRKYFAKSIDLQFEDMLCKCPICYDDYLKYLYGEYMKLPPKEKRKSHHNFEVFLINS